MRLATFFDKSALIIFVSENVKEMWLNDLFWGIRAHFWGGIHHFLVMNDHFGGPTVHCGQILQKILARGRPPTPFLAMPVFWVHMDPQPTPNGG